MVETEVAIVAAEMEEEDKKITQIKKPADNQWAFLLIVV